MNKRIVIATFDNEVYKIDGPLHEGLSLAAGEGIVTMGQVVSYDDTTGKLLRHIPGTNKAFSIIFLANGEPEINASTADMRVSILRGNSRFNKKHVVGMDPDLDFQSVRELWENGIYLEEVIGGDE